MNPSRIDKGFLSFLQFEPLGSDNWQQLQKLFGEKGACAHCWCMYSRLNKSDFEEGKTNEGNKTDLKNLVENKQVTGLLGFYEDIPIA